MATYRTFAELQSNQLQHGDRVIFEHDGFSIVYKVGSTSLVEINDNIEIENNIFKLLGLNAYEFCEQHYTKLQYFWEERKMAHPSHWPVYCGNDYESFNKAVTKAVLELFRLIEEQKQLAETSEIFSLIEFIRTAGADKGDT